MMNRPQRRRRVRAGFTLVEMMIALVAGLIAISSIYYVSSASSRHFHEQQRIAQSQMSLRMAMNQIRRDVARAGYLHSPNTAVEQTCVNPPRRFQAVNLVAGGSSSSLTLQATNVVAADTLVLEGNYLTGDAYLANQISGTQLQLQSTRQSFRRSFGDPMDTVAFEDVFREGRVLWMMNDKNNVFFADIVSSTGSTRTVTIAQPLPFGTSLGCHSTPTGILVAPVARIQYVVLETGSAGSIARLRSNSPIAGVNGPTLVRREVNMATGTPIAGTERVVAEYVAEFDVDFIADSNTNAANPPSLSLVDDAAAEALVTANPHRVRTARVRLSLRNATEDPRFPFVPRGGHTLPLLRYELDTAAPGAARVRTMRADIYIPNVADRGILQ